MSATLTPAPGPRLGVNIDHVATVRNARGAPYPDPLRAAQLAEAAGADGVTAHLREDRRHITDDDIRRLKDGLNIPLNLEMAATGEMLSIALNALPRACCIVPEKREEKTTEGGLDVVDRFEDLKAYVGALADAGIRVSLFIDPVEHQIEAASLLGAPVVELHTGAYCEAALATNPKRIEAEFEAIREGADFADSLGLEVHAGHGLTFQTVQPIAALQPIAELNIGHFLVAEAIFMGLPAAVKEMRRLMEDARTGMLV